MDHSFVRQPERDGQEVGRFRHGGGLPGRIGEFTMEAWSTGTAATYGFPALYPMTSRPSDSRDSAAIAALIEQFDVSRDESSQLEAYDALVAMGSKAVPALIDALEHEERGRREGAGHVLWAIGPAAREAVPALIVALRTEEGNLRRIAVEALIAIGPGKDAVPALIDALNHSHRSLRDAAVYVLKVIGPAAKEAVPALLTALSDKCMWLSRDSICHTLGAIGKDAAPALVAHFNDDSVDPELIEFALKCVGQDAVPYLLDALRRGHTNRRIRGHVAQALERIGKDAIPDLMALWKDETGVIRYEAARILAQIDPDLIVGIPFNTEPLSEDDERLLRWFEQIDMTEYQTKVQVFWCVGYIDKEAIQSAGMALGLKRLSKRLREIDPIFKRDLLPVSIGYLRETCFQGINKLFNNEPFCSEAWAPEERTLGIRSEVKYKERREPCWTPKAWKAWQYVDRFLRLQKLLPTIINEDGDRWQHP